MQIDLGRKSSDCYPCAPCQASEKDSVHYPCLYIDGTESLKEIPESGTMTVAFKRNSCTVTDRDGKVSASISLDITKILDVEPDASTGKDKEDTESILEGLAKEYSEKD